MEEKKMQAQSLLTDEEMEGINGGRIISPWNSESGNRDSPAAREMLKYKGDSVGRYDLVPGKTYIIDGKWDYLAKAVAWSNGYERGHSTYAKFLVLESNTSNWPKNTVVEIDVSTTFIARANVICEYTGP